MKDITGKTFGKLTAIKIVTTGKHPKWLCSCECGNVKVIRLDHLLSGASQLPKLKLPAKDIDAIKTFVKNNADFLDKLADQKITFFQFCKQMKI